MNYFVISHTHWDREWYEPFEQFRIRLVCLIDNLLELLKEDKNFIFHLDAQTSVLEDYLEIKPYNRRKLKKYISEGKILVGPWYVQNDFYLTSGEATIRNLLIGTEIANEFGKCDKAGYAPDQFGLISQLPQILNQFDIDNCIFGRGICYNLEQNNYEGISSITQSEFYWVGEDGSKVLGIHMPFWYNNAQRFPENIKKSIKYLEAIKENALKTTKGKNLLLMNGVDHLEAQEDLLPILNQVDDLLPAGDKIEQSTLCKYVKAVKTSKIVNEEIRGELRYGPESSILHGTLSSRSYLKIANVKAQNALERQLEPIMTITSLSGFGYQEYEDDFLKYLWKLLIQNHPHDSICGCSHDSVHSHMMDRFERLNENIEYILPKKYALISNHLNEIEFDQNSYTLTVFNTQPYKRSITFEAIIELPESEKIESFTLVDPNGSEVAFEVLEKTKYKKPLRSPINLPGNIDVDAYKILLHSRNVPAMGYKAILVKPLKIKEENVPTEENLNFENRYIKVEIENDGRINLFDKRRLKKYEDILYFEDREDCGDSYIYKSSEKGLTISSEYFQPRITCLHNSPLRTQYKLTYYLRIPLYFDFNTNTRSKETAANKLEVFLELTKSSKRLEIKVKYNNASKDHRLRAVFNTGIFTDYTNASAPFDLLTKDRNSYWLQKRTWDKSEAMTDFIEIHNNLYGVAVLTEGLHSYEHLQGGKIAITLLRGNGYIHSWENIPKDKTWIVPENQCLGEFNCTFAIRPYSPRKEAVTLKNYSQEFLTPPLWHFDNVDAKKFTGGRTCVQDTDIAEIFHRPDPYKNINLPAEKSFLRINNRAVVLSAFKKAEKNDALIVRCFNTTSHIQPCKIRFGFNASRIFKIKMSEAGTGQLLIKNTNLLKVELKPKEILTLEIYT